MIQKKKRKICVVVASRANYARIKSVLHAIQNHPNLELQLIVGASALLDRFGKVVDLMKQDGFKIHSTVYIVVEGENLTTMAKSTGLAIIELATVFDNLRPDIVLTVADRYETMATAISASYMNIPLAHTQGGEVTGSIDESVRHAITKLAHIHFPTTELSQERLIKMGEDPKMIFKVGCPSLDLILEQDLPPLYDLFDRYGGVGAKIDLKKQYLVVLQHPVTTEYGSGFLQIKETLQAIQELNMQTIWLWPNVDAGSDDIAKGLRVFREKNRDCPVHFFKNFSTEDYLRLINHAVCLVGNSSSALREGAFLGVPAVNIGTRQQGRERAENVIDVDYDAEQIKAAILKQVEHGKYTPSQLYGDGKSGKRIADILATCDLKIQKSLTYSL